MSSFHHHSGKIIPRLLFEPHSGNSLKGKQGLTALEKGFAPKAIRKLVRARRNQLVANGVISEEEAERIKVFWYPPALSDEEQALEEQEDEEALDR